MWEVIGYILLIGAGLLLLYGLIRLLWWFITKAIPLIAKVVYWLLPAAIALPFVLSGEWWAFIPVLCAVGAYVGMFFLRRWWLERH